MYCVAAKAIFLLTNSLFHLKIAQNYRFLSVWKPSEAWRSAGNRKLTGSGTVFKMPVALQPPKILWGQLWNK